MEFRVLGPVEVVCAGRALNIGSLQQRRLLAALLIDAGRVVSADHLLWVLWGDEPPPTALKSLRAYVSRLRAALYSCPGAGRELTTRSRGYVLCVGPEDVDAGRFERLVADGRTHLPQRADRALAHLDEALSLWRGPAFAEFADAEFAQPDVARLEELRLAAVETRFDALLALGKHASLAADIQAVVEQHPFRERLRAQLMLALYRSGRQADALAAYQSLRKQLAEELGLEPSPDLRALEADILRQDPVLDRRPPASRSRSVEGDGSSPAAGEGSSPGELPVEVTRFIGRHQECAELLAILGVSGSVTLTGVGGVGKTRLALEVANAVRDRYADGVWWCELAAVRDQDALGHAVARALGARDRQGPIEDSIVQLLRTKQALVVLDNCEHVVDRAASFVNTVVQACPRVTVLATSRTPLGFKGERCWPVGPLPLPGALTPPSEAGRVAAVELFIDRARAVRPQLELNDDEVVTIASLCRRLDGLPLAIELAAARLGSLNPSDIADRLDKRFALLSDTRPTAEARHRTLGAVLDWSYALLSETEQRLFERLSVFAGSFALETAERVCAGGAVVPDEVMALLGRLVDHSMVVAAPAGGPVRYSLLETLRQYGRQRLAERGEADAYSVAHARCHLELAEQTAPALHDRRESSAVSILDRELPNFRAAYLHAVTVGDSDLAMRLVAALFRYALWRLRDEVFRWAESALELPGARSHPLFPMVSGMVGWGCGLRGERHAAAAFAERALAALPPDDPARLYPLEVLLHLAMWEGRPDECYRLCQEAAGVAQARHEWVPRGAAVLALTYAGRTGEAIEAAEGMRGLCVEQGNPTLAAYICYAHGEALLERDPTAAAALFDRAVTLAASVDNRMLLGVAAVSAASLRARHGSLAEALAAFGPVIDHLHRGADWTHLWVGLRSLVELLARVGADESAAVLHAAVTSAPTAPPVYGADAERLSAVGRTLEGRLGSAAMAATRAAAATMADEHVVAFARGEIDRLRAGKVA